MTREAVRWVCDALTLVALLVVVVSGVSCAGGRSEGDAGGSAEVESGDDDSRSERRERRRRGEDEEDEPDDRVPVEVAAVGRGPIEAVLRLSTNLEAENEVQVFSQAARQVVRRFVEEGDLVRKGQVLVALQDDEQRTQLGRIQSQLEKAQRDYDRQRNLFEQNLISEQTFNEATYDLDQLKLTLADAQRELSYTQVRAPISGTVTQRLVNVGDQVTVNQHLFDIVDFDSIVARVYVPEKALPRLRNGQEARILAEAMGGAERRGVVDRVAPVVDARSGTVKVTVKIPPEEELLPGMYVSVELVTDVHEDAVLVPKKALVYDDDQIYVYRLLENDEDGLVVERLFVEAALEDQEYIEPAGVVSPGDQIVIAGQAGLKDGTSVRLVERAE